MLGQIAVGAAVWYWWQSEKRGRSLASPEGRLRSGWRRRM